MKNIKILGVFTILVVLLGSCRKLDPVDEEHSIFQPQDPATITKFDNWIMKNISYPYNIGILYKFTDINTDPRFVLVPADIEKSQLMLQVIKYAWLEAYDEVLGVDFTRKYAPKQFMFVGSSAFTGGNTKVLATAEGGVKITMYEINFMKLDPTKLNEDYFHVIHHEFSHILHQTKNYSTDYQKISEGDYVKDDWSYGPTLAEAQRLGFVSTYSMREPQEDFAEVYSIYITTSDSKWKTLLANAGEAGAAKINKKLELIREYTREAWGFELDALRSTVLRRAARITQIPYEDFN